MSLKLKERKMSILHVFYLWANLHYGKKLESGSYSWLQQPEDEKARLFKIIGIYSSFQDLVKTVESLNNKVEKIK